MKALLCQTLSVLGLNMEYEKFTYLVLCGILVADLRNVFCGIIGSCLLLILVWTWLLCHALYPCMMCVSPYSTCQNCYICGPGKSYLKHGEVIVSTWLHKTSISHAIITEQWINYEFWKKVTNKEHEVVLLTTTALSVVPLTLYVYWLVNPTTTSVITHRCTLLTTTS